MSGISIFSRDFINPPASATVEVKIPTLAKIYLKISYGNLKKIDLSEIPINSMELYLCTVR